VGMGEGQVPGEALAPLPLTAITTKLPSNDRYTQQMWMTVASYMAANTFTADRAQSVANEIGRRMEIMDCSYGQAITSVWDDIKAGRWRPREHG
jgi:hypothetical protein